MTGDTARKTLTLRREVPLDGWASSDTHVHPLTYSGHGDCTAEERVLTLASESLELPADHDEAVCAQAAALLRAKGVSMRDEKVREAARASGADVARAFDTYAEACRASQIARETAKRP